MFENTKVLFRCPHRCDTWQLGTVAGRIGDSYVIIPDCGNGYVYPPHTAYVFGEKDKDISYMEYENKYASLIGKGTHVF